MTLQEPVGNVLIVDDNTEFQLVAANFAELSHCAATQATTLREARRLTRDEQFDLMMIDINLPDGNGFDLLDDIDLTAHGQIAIVTGNPTVESAVRAVRSPVVEYLLKPVATGALAALLERAYLRAQTRHPIAVPQFAGMLGQHPLMQELFDRIRRVAPLDVSVLIQGESGTGKELVARAVHDLSGRTGRFVPVNCGAIAPDLMSSQLFGHERGSFTGALQSHAGYFEQAEGGTLFLDEITEMPPALQVYLLRVLESRSLTRVGGSREIPIDVRVIAATNRDPQQAVAAGVLRSDLYYRLVEFPLSVPTLCERRIDIPMLAQHFLDRLNERYKTQRLFSPEALRQLLSRPWPGNVRELRHAVQRLYILANDDLIRPQADQLFRPTEDNDGSVRFHVGMTFDDIEREMLLKTLAYHGNNKRQAARALGITAKTIYNRLLRYRELGLIGDDQVGDPEITDAG
ncbi:MAG TPA: sigma-54 dependent transcriptional regulator [Rudaea sp.]|nr:sigma-54 dependent transcriptional regulator [Rudaea sp.]